MSAVETAIVTPTVRAWWRRARFWFGAVALVIVIAIVALVMNGTGTAGDALDPRNPAPIGAKAIAEVLRQQGVDVVIAERLEDVEAALADGAPTTLLIDDWRGILGASILDELTLLDASRVVLLDPTADALDVLLPGVRRSGITTDPASAAECALAEASGLGTITGRATLFDISGADGAESVLGCYPMDSGLVRIVATPTTIAFGPLGLLANEQILEESNAALALHILGTEPRLVWYRPGLTDADVEAPPTLGTLSPGWVVPVMLLLIVTFFAAAYWRGRRMGPLVVEALPSIVPADETMRGRARMYARSRSRLRAADALRIGTLGRISIDLGLPTSAGVDSIALAAATVTGWRLDRIRALLRDDDPSDDAALLRISTELLQLEREIARTTRPTEPGE